MALEAMTEGFRTQVQRAGDAWLQQGRWSGRRRSGKTPTLTRTAAQRHGGTRGWRRSTQPRR